MNTGIIYFIIIIFANTVGAISGMGGGVIIKPCLDFLGLSPLSAINFYSSFAVFVMAIVSTSKQLKNGIKINYILAGSLSLGALLGGKLGDSSFRLLIGLTTSKMVNLIQIGLTIVTLLLALRYSKTSTKTTENPLLGFLIGLLLGWLATLLGIGGGPINVALLLVMFGLKVKDATVYSIIIIFFSQLSKLATALPHLQADQVHFSLLPYILAAAIIGGFVGALLSKQMSERLVLKFYRYIVIFVILLNLFNGFRIIV